MGVLLAAACGDDTTSSGASGGDGPGGASGAGGGDVGPIQATVERYALRFDLEARTLVTTLSLDVTVAGDCFTIPSERDPSSVLFDGAPATVTRSGDATVLCGPSLGLGAHEVQATTTVEQKTYSGLDVGFSDTTDLSGDTFSYLLSWVGGCDHFGPCDDAPDRLVEITYDIDHPAGTVALCPGVLTPGATSTHCELSGARAPTYSAYAFAADPAWESAPLVSGGGVDVVLFEVPGGTLRDSIDAPSLASFLDWSTQRFGALPYGSELRLAGAPTVWLGFEHPANIVLDEHLGDTTLPYASAAQHVTMHEIAHQWAGDATTLASAQDFAWKEAISEYVAYVFEDESRPAGEADASRAYWDGISPGASYHVRPTDEPPPSVEAFYGDVYGPGPMTLFVQLEPLIGRDAVLTAIAAFLSGGGVRSVDDLRVALETASGEDLGDYFAAWVFGAGAPVWPVFTVTTTDVGGGMVEVTVTQSQAGGVTFPCRVEIDVAGASATATAEVDFGLHPATSSASVTIPFAEAVTSTSIDPRHRVIDVSAGVKRSSWPVYKL